jgi:hypothetical protein
VTAPSDEKDRRIDALQAELDAVRRREAEFRAKTVLEFLDRGERNTHLHILREERAALIKREQESFADLESLTRKVEAESARASALDGELDRMRHSVTWRLGAPLRALGRLFTKGRPATPAAPAAGMNAPAEGAVFTYYLHTSPFRIYRQPTFTLRGWAWPRDGRSICAVRVNLGGRLFVGRIGIEEPDVIERHGPQPANPRPGFEVAFETPPGRHLLSLEAQLAGGEWRSIMTTSIWCEPPGR